LNPTLSNITDFESFLTSAEDSFSKLGDLSKNENLSPEERENLSKQYYEKLDEVTKVYKSILGSVKQRGKGEKVSKYTLSEAVRKHKLFAYSVLNIEEDSDIETITSWMYELMDEVLNEEDLNKKFRLGQLYSIALKKNLASFKENMVEMIDEHGEDENIYDLSSDFYGAYFKMIVEAVTKRYNEEVEERVKAQEEMNALRKQKAEKMETANDIVTEVESSNV